MKILLLASAIKEAALFSQGARKLEQGYLQSFNWLVLFIKILENWKEHIYCAWRDSVKGNCEYPRIYPIKLNYTVDAWTSHFRGSFMSVENRENEQ